MKNDMKKILTTLGMICLLATMGCKTPKQVDSSYAYTPSGVECMGNNGDGTQTVRAWGRGPNKTKAIENARKNAVRTFLFKGITAGNGNCTKRPLVTEVNAEEKYESYFNRFFADGGEYKAFTSMDDEKRTSRVKAADLDTEKWGVVVTVDYTALKAKMIEDGIIKP